MENTWTKSRRSSECDDTIDIRSPPSLTSSSISTVKRQSPRSSSIAASLFLLSILALSSIAPVRSFSTQSPYSTKQTVGMERQRTFSGLDAAPIDVQDESDCNGNGNGNGNGNDEKEGPSVVVIAAAGSPSRIKIPQSGTDDGYDGLGEYDPSENLPQNVANVGDPQLRVKVKDPSVTDILKELAAIQQQGPQKYCILGTRHCSFLHQQIIELLAYALVLSGNHVYTSGAPGTNAATVRGALRAEREDLLTVVLPQSFSKQTQESQELLEKVDDLITMPQNDELSLDVASRICNSYLLSMTDQLISFAFHESTTVIEANKEAKKLDMLVTTLYLD
eukprot:CAMPEP_0172391584 /NCGR_PEP_ID=MMETSP1061-20121228/7949_1 /TAXON_ID=37318 /ORGANISM="Pseudo-nitzschia pungens, Strain cf. pungens" /LENGTH=334 /DNA_ID=CAMNT_0013122241 /DNA_START=84 /DNA_END=1088 /DNA_ORIENTATION=-